jgi:hypothetical protein
MKMPRESLTNVSAIDPGLKNLVEDLKQETVWIKGIDANGKDKIEKRTQAINDLFQNGSYQAMNILVAEWSKWVAVDYDPLIVDSVEKLVKLKATSIRPLVATLEKTLGTDPAVKSQIESDVLFQSGISNEEITSCTNERWKSLIKQYELVIQKKSEEAHLKMRRKIAQALFEISTQIIPERSVQVSKDDEVSQEQKQTKDIFREFDSQAVATMVRILDKENDLEIRENIAWVLGNINNEKTTEALVRSIRGESRRINMLDQYYLKPAQDKSKEARKFLDDLIDQAKNTLNWIKWMNLAVFTVGLVIVCTAVTVSLLSDNLGTRIAAAISGIGGLAGVITCLVKDPLNRIQNSMSNLAQTETAFYNFMWDLDVSDTYIQSQYVAKGILSDEDIAKTIKRIDTVSCSTIELLESYIEEGREVQISYIKTLSPPIGKVGSEVTIHGKFFFLSGSKEKPLVIAINHKPTLTKVTSTKADEIVFNVPEETLIQGDKESTIWISVINCGVETNAKPFQVTGK